MKIQALVPVLSTERLCDFFGILIAWKCEAGDPPAEGQTRRPLAGRQGALKAHWLRRDDRSNAVMLSRWE
jgi:hypothetical protein